MLPVNKGRRNEYNILGENPAGDEEAFRQLYNEYSIYFTDMG